MPEQNVYNQQVMDYHTAGAITDSLFTGAGYGSAGEFLTNLAGQETLYGTLPSHMTDEGVPISMGAFQVDPIRYKDFLTASEGGAGKDRLNMINQFMRNRGYGEDFNLAEMATLNEGVDAEGNKTYAYSNVNQQLARDPLASTMLTRTLLASDPNALPTELYNVNPVTGQREKDAGNLLLEKYGSWGDVPDEMLGQSGYWKKNWNTDAGAGKTAQFEEKFETYRQSITKEDDIMNSMKGMDELDFNIGAPSE